MPAIEVQGLSRRFGEVLAVDHLSFSVEKGEVFGVLGPNGAGKTTTVRLLNGILAPTEGRIRILGLDPAVEGAQVRANTGVLTESPSLYEKLSARENLSFFGKLYGVPPQTLPGRVEELLELFGLRERADDPAGGFSKGMKQRLVLARALVHNPPILFLDEPTSGLDPEAAHQVNELIARLRSEGRTIFLCTHRLAEAEPLCDRVALFNHGRLLAMGTIPELARRLWGGDELEIELLQVDEQAWDGFSLEGKVLRAPIASPEEAARLVTQVVEKGGKIVRVSPRRHTLEEIYFAFQEKEGK